MGVYSKVKVLNGDKRSNREPKARVSTARWNLKSLMSEAFVVPLGASPNTRGCGAPFRGGAFLGCDEWGRNLRPVALRP